MKRLPTPYQEFIHLSRYSRWLEDKKRRETWDETVARYFDFFADHLREKCGYEMEPHVRKELEKAVLDLKIMPSMRCLMTAGPALKRDNVAGYNCAYAAIKRAISLDEVMYILMCGTGAGFSPEMRYADKLPVVANEFHESDTVIVVRDSKIGWCKAFKELISLLYAGQIPKWDVSKVRPAGVRLKTFGGRASGPQPLVNLFEFCCRLFPKASGRKLLPIEVHDIVCYIAKIVVVGGVRRSALISLSDLTDALMREAKTGDWYADDKNPQRALSNNSAVYESRPPMSVFMTEWKSLYDSKSGERGIFNRAAARNVVRRNGRRDPNHEWGTNPCSEIILRDCQFCNLSEAILRHEDTTADIAEKVRLATIFGTWQSTLTDFRYLSAEWKRNCEEERLLGVSLTGIQDHPVLREPYEMVGQMLREFRQVAIDTNAEWAAKLKINQSAAITCVKPSGTVSQLSDCASGIHARWSPHYIRRVQGSRLDPICRFMIDKGFPYEQSVYGSEQICFSFPIKSPPSAPTRTDITAVGQLELWKMYQENWCEHKPSCTVYIKEHEWLSVGAWVYENFDDISGIAFLPHSDHAYAQAPYTDCTEEEYNALVAKMPTDVDWSEMSRYETEDNTIGSQTMACTGDTCEVVDLA
jgi:ribonucleoside-diphosphate reductase alpha chain